MQRRLEGTEFEMDLDAGRVVNRKHVELTRPLAAKLASPPARNLGSIGIGRHGQSGA